MIRAIMIVEIAGRPPEYVKDKLSKHMMTLEKMEDVKIYTVKISEPKEVANSNGVYSCFSEADFEVPDLMRLAEVVFDYFPSSVEILEPSNVSFSNLEATTLLNNISGRIHRYDEFARIAGVKIKQMEEEIKKLAEGKEPEKTEKKKVKKKSVKKVKKKD